MPKRPSHTAEGSRRDGRWFVLAGFLVMATGCGLSNSKEALDADIASAREDMNHSWKDYQICLQERDEDPDLPCDEIKDLYEDDKELYEELVKLRQAKSS